MNIWAVLVVEGTRVVEEVTPPEKAAKRRRHRVLEAMRLNQLDLRVKHRGLSLFGLELKRSDWRLRTPLFLFNSRSEQVLDINRLPDVESDLCRVVNPSFNQDIIRTFRDFADVIHVVKAK